MEAAFGFHLEDQLMKQGLRMVASVIRHEAERLASASAEKPQRNFNEALRQLREVLLISS